MGHDMQQTHAGIKVITVGVSCLLVASKQGETLQARHRLDS